MKKTMKSHLLLLSVAMSAMFLLAATSAEMPETKTSVRLQKEMKATGLEPMAVIEVDISGPWRGNNSGLYTWTVSATGGTAPYTYIWQYSINQIDYHPFNSGTGTSQTANLPLDFDLHLRVTAIDANGAQAVGLFTTWNVSGSPHPGD
jgi:hypothetical protein